MNRKEELNALLEEFNRDENFESNAFEKAEKKLKKRKYFYKPMSFAASFILFFVVLVNFSAPVAYGFSKIPLIRDLAKAVTFSPSLSKAVENEYMQKVEQSEKKKGIYASVDYIIVDQKNVNIFFHTESSKYKNLATEADIFAADGSDLEGYSLIMNNFGADNGQLQSVTADFTNSTVPDGLRLRLKTYDRDFTESAEYSDYKEPEYIAIFDFILNFDPEFTAAGKNITAGEKFEIDGQKFAVSDIEVYPSNMRINISAEDENTKWLKKLYFTVIDDKGRRFNSVSEGITATGDIDTPMMKSYRVESPYFYNSKFVTIYIEGAQFLDKSREKIYIDLKNNTSGKMPDGSSLYKTYKKGGNWVIEIKAATKEENCMYQVLLSRFWDKEGKEYYADGWGSSIVPFENADNIQEDGEHFYTQIYLGDYPYDEVWIEANYSDEYYENKAEELKINMK